MVQPGASCSPDEGSPFHLPTPRDERPESHEELPTGHAPVSRRSPRKADLDTERALRAACGRIFGFSGRHADDATQALLDAAERRAVVSLRGACDLVPIAYSLHRQLFGRERLFIVADPRRHENDGDVRSPPSRSTALAVLDDAMGGSVCLRARRLPDDFDAFVERLRDGHPAAMVFVCLDEKDHVRDRVRDLLCPPLDVPPLRKRKAELDRLLFECLEEAARALAVPPVHLSRKTRATVIENVSSLAELEKTALRVVALLSYATFGEAATRLGMAPVSLSRWTGRRRWFSGLLEDCHGGAEG